MAAELETTWAAFAADLCWEDIPEAVRHEAKRSILNIIATAFSGCSEEAVEKALAAMQPFSSGGTVSLVGRAERCDPLLAAVAHSVLTLDPDTMTTQLLEDGTNND